MNVLVVAGTVTDKLAPLVLAAYRDLPEPRRVLSFGACSNSGGPYWDSYCVTKGADQIIPVDVYVPGCPPRPEALVHGLRLLRDATRGAAVTPGEVLAEAARLLPAARCTAETGVAGAGHGRRRSRWTCRARTGWRRWPSPATWPAATSSTG